MGSSHDWHSETYVDDWIRRDMQRDDERRPHLREMISLAPHDRTAPLRVLDVGGGFGVVAEEVLRMFPKAHVVLQDYSEPMLKHARRRLSRFAGQVTFIRADLRNSSWKTLVDGPFDLVVSAIALHNLEDNSAIADCYGAIRGLLDSNGVFADYDLFDHVGGVAAHRRLFEAAGFNRVACPWQEPPAAVIVGRN